MRKQRATLRDEKNSGRSGNEQLELLRNAACGAVVEKDPLGLNFHGQRQRLPLANAERLPPNGLRQQAGNGPWWSQASTRWSL
jgi:hypothetical protein